MTHFLLEWWQISWAYESNDYSMSLNLGVYFESCFFLCFGISFCRLFLSSVLSVTLKRMWLESLWVLFFSSRFFIVFVPASCCLFRDKLVVKKIIFSSFCSPLFFYCVIVFMAWWSLVPHFSLSYYQPTNLAALDRFHRFKFFFWWFLMGFQRIQRTWHPQGFGYYQWSKVDCICAFFHALFFFSTYTERSK